MTRALSHRRKYAAHMSHHNRMQQQTYFLYQKNVNLHHNYGRNVYTQWDSQ